MSVRRPTVVGMSPETLRLSPPPALRPREGSGSALLLALPALGGVASVALVASMGMGASGTLRTRSLLAAGVVLVTTVGFVLVQLDRQRRQQQLQRGGSRSDYLDYLGGIRETVREAAALQRASLIAAFPDPSALPFLTRAPTAPAAAGAGPLPVRVGLGSRPLDLLLVPPERTPGEPPDPVAATALERLLHLHRTQPDLPVTVDLDALRRIEVDRSGARALVCSAAARYGPGRLRIAVLASPELLGRWEWAKWLPHAGSLSEDDETGPARLIATDPSALALASSDPGHLVMVLDGVPHDQDVTTLLGRMSSHSVIEINAEAAPLATAPDRCSVATAEVIARRLSSRHPQTAGSPDTLADLLRADAGSRQRLRVPIGVTHSGAPLLLDLRESAEGGDGPHGLVVGATGSGKSELLRTLTVALALVHPPEELNLVLVDFKGGATFAGLGTLPHTSALITNLSDDLALVDRMHDALAGELVRRQEVLRAAGDFASLRDLDAARASRADLPSLPALLVVIDEFSELLTTRPELAELFAGIGRLGRSLGIHLLLATQRLDEGRLRGLEAHLGFRIALRTFSAAESRAAIGVTDAHDLPRTPGVGYLSTGPGALVRFRAAHVSSPVAPRDTTPPRVLPFTAAPVVAPDPPAMPGQPAPSFLDSAVAAASEQAGEDRRAHRIWLPPLRGTVPLTALVPDVAADPDLGLVSPAWRSVGPRTFPIGVVDRPREQRHEPLVVRLDGATGHAAVVGAPRSGTSTLLRTLVTGLALTGTPAETQFLLVDLAGGDLTSLSGLPHVIATADRRQPERVRRILSEAITRADGDNPSELFLVIDGWGGVRELFPDLEADLAALAQRSLSSGVHLIVSATRWGDLRPALRDVIGTRLELRLGDPSESGHGRQLACLVPVEPGRGLAPGGHHFLAAHPGDPGEFTARVREAWRGPDAPPLVDLPSQVDLARLLHEHAPGSADTLTLGVGEDLAPLRFTPAELPHLIVYGDSGSGRSALLRTIASEVVRTHEPEEARIVVVDPRRSLLGEVPERHLLDHVATPDAITSAMTDLAEVLRGRQPRPDVSRAELRARSWWTGPEVWLLVDDHDLLTAGAALMPLHDLLPHAPEIGLHLVVTRRAHGAARAQHEPTLRILRDSRAPVLLLDGPPEEGPLAGPHRAAPQPPGRGLLVTGRAARQVQLAWLDPAE
ncbi:type VII secretion protein EccCb [Nocardioides cavernaquae]|uniref:Type VII secretion protein EccCb n=2 Tax=Nocardioides cavernaquae TaxID=2321396 RepID=A0A3A5HBZ1_9ACTN|nr:type VII secretion protein EccCb [Nocardioides cavernaquae]